MFIWQPVQRFLHWCGAKYFDRKYNRTYQRSVFLFDDRLIVRRVCFPMGSYGAPTLKYTVSLGLRILNLEKF